MLYIFWCIWQICEYFPPFRRLSFWSVDYFISFFIFSFVNFKIIFIYSCLYAWSWTHVEDRVQLVQIDSFLQSYVSQKENSGHQAWWKVSLPTEQSCLPYCLFVWFFFFFCHVKVTWFVVILFAQVSLYCLCFKSLFIIIYSQCPTSHSKKLGLWLEKWSKAKLNYLVAISIAIFLFEKEKSRKLGLLQNNTLKFQVT